MTLMKKGGGGVRGGPLASSIFLPAICVAILISPSAKAQEKSSPAPVFREPIAVWRMRHGSGVQPFDRIPPWLGPRLSSLCTTFPIDSAQPDHPARVAPPFLGPVVRLLTFPGANMPCPASSGKSHLSARVRLLFGAAEALRRPAIVPSANFPSLETVARSRADFAPAIGLPCDAHPSPHPVALPIPKSIPNCFLLWHHADPAPAPLRMLCVLRERGISCNTRAPENTRLPYSSAQPPRLSPAT